MDEEVEEYKDPKLKDIKYNWVDSSVFLFYLEVFCIIALLWVVLMDYMLIGTRVNPRL